MVSVIFMLLQYFLDEGIHKFRRYADIMNSYGQRRISME